MGPLDWEEHESQVKKAKDDMFEPLKPGQKRRRRKKTSSDNIDSEVFSRPGSPSGDTQNTEHAKNKADTHNTEEKEEVVNPNVIKIEEKEIDGDVACHGNSTKMNKLSEARSVSSGASRKHSSDVKKETGQSLSISEINNSVEWEFPKSGEEYSFELKKHHMVTENGKKLFKCDICLGLYKHMFSLKRHYLRNHVNYKYLSKSDMANCLINLAQVVQQMQSKLLVKEEKKGSEADVVSDKTVTKGNQSVTDDMNDSVGNGVRIPNQQQSDEELDIHGCKLACDVCEDEANSDVCEDNANSNACKDKANSNVCEDETNSHNFEDKANKDACEDKVNNDVCEDKANRNTGDDEANCPTTEEKSSCQTGNAEFICDTSTDIKGGTQVNRVESIGSETETEGNVKDVDEHDLTESRGKQAKRNLEVRNTEECSKGGLEKMFVAEKETLKNDSGIIRNEIKSITTENCRDDNQIEVSMPGLFRCYTCYLTFDDFESIREHTQNHPEQTDGACFPCDVCRMRFNYKHNLVRHRKTHENAGTVVFRLKIHADVFISHR